MRTSRCPNKRGRTYLRPKTGTVCPRRNAFGTPSLGVLQAVSFFQNYQFCLGQQPKPQIVCCVFSGRLLLTDADDSTTDARYVQAWFCAGHGHAIGGAAFLSAAHWGWRGRASGVGGGWGFRPRHISFNGGSGRLACRMPASWRADCPRNGRLRAAGDGGKQSA